MKTISASELEKKLRNKDDLQLVDVREPYEFKVCHLPGAKLIPLHSIPEKIQEIDRNKTVVIYCHRGIRSDLVIQYLTKKQGYRNLLVLAGGINAWASEVDKSMRQY